MIKIVKIRVQISLISVIIIKYVYWRDGMKDIELTDYTIESQKISMNCDGYKLAVMSDLHSNSYGIDLHRLNRMIKKANPDAVLVAGDMINDTLHDNPCQAVNYLAALSGHFPVFYALGNHEYRLKTETDIFGDRYYTIREHLTNKGVVFLEDETVYLDKDDSSIALSGVEIDSAFYDCFRTPGMGKSLMRRHLGQADRNKLNILIAHNPDYFDRYAEWGADIVISGHIHGGIIRIPGVGGLVSPRFTLFPKYDSGMYFHNDSMMLVSRGLGSHTINVRINNAPELAVLNILPAI